MLIKDEEKAKKIYEFLRAITALLIVIPFATLQMIGMPADYSIHYVKNGIILWLISEVIYMVFIYRKYNFEYSMSLYLVTIVILSLVFYN